MLVSYCFFVLFFCIFLAILSSLSRDRIYFSPKDQFTSTMTWSFQPSTDLYWLINRLCITRNTSLMNFYLWSVFYCFFFQIGNWKEESKRNLIFIYCGAIMKTKQKKMVKILAKYDRGERYWMIGWIDKWWYKNA